MCNNKKTKSDKTKIITTNKKKKKKKKKEREKERKHFCINFFYLPWEQFKNIHNTCSSKCVASTKYEDAEIITR